METWKHTKLYIVFNIGDLWTPFGAAWKNVISTKYKSTEIHGRRLFCSYLDQVTVCEWSPGRWWRPAQERRGERPDRSGWRGPAALGWSASGRPLKHCSGTCTCHCGGARPVCGRLPCQTPPTPGGDGSTRRGRLHLNRILEIDCREKFTSSLMNNKISTHNKFQDYDI